MTIIVLALALNLVMSVWAPEAGAQIQPAQKLNPQDSEMKLFTAPDPLSPEAGTLQNGEAAIPIAETLGAEGVTWFLVKSRTGVVGWIKKSDAEASKKVEQFFKSLPLEPSLPIAADIPASSSKSAPRGSIIVPVQMNGPAVIVPVTLNRTLNTYMALDTGATRSVLSRRIAASLGLRISESTAVVETANGRLAVATAHLASTKVGEAEVENLVVTVHNFSSNPALGGLLGLDFLRRFHVSLDSRKQVLVLSHR